MRSFTIGLSDLWTLRRWLTWVRLARAVVVLVVATVAFGAHVFGSSDPPGPSALPVMPPAQARDLCRESMPEYERTNREFEKETGTRPPGITLEMCAELVQRQRDALTELGHP